MTPFCTMRKCKPKITMSSLFDQSSSCSKAREYQVTCFNRWRQASRSRNNLDGTLGLRCYQQSISKLITYMKKFLHSDWLRACQLIPNSAKTWHFFSAREWNWVQSCEIKKWLTAHTLSWEKQNGVQTLNEEWTLNFNKITSSQLKANYKAQ